MPALADLHRPAYWVRSNTLADLLHGLVGGSGEGYSLRLPFHRGLAVVRADARPDVIAHEQQHLDGQVDDESLDMAEWMKNRLQGEHPYVARATPYTPMTPEMASYLQGELERALANRQR